jgi:hypothetical protein
MTTGQYKLFLSSLGIKSDKCENHISEDIADIKAELLKRYFGIAKKISGHTELNCHLEILTEKIRASIFVKTIRPQHGDVGVIYYRCSCDDDLDDVFFEYPLATENRIAVVCKPQEIIMKCDEIFNSECTVVVGLDEYRRWLELHQLLGSISTAVSIQELLNSLVKAPSGSC